MQVAHAFLCKMRYLACIGFPAVTPEAPKLTKAQVFEHETTSVSLDDLLEVEKAQERTQDRPAVLPISALRVATEVFQWRKFRDQLEAEESHVRELVRVLTSCKEPLDPILVTPVGGHFYVVDGHHRLLAYHSVEWEGPIPVAHFEGSVEEARLEGLRLNRKNKLAMTQEDKFEAAWTLVKEGEKHSKREIRELTTVSDGTIATMRRVLREHPEARDEPWRRAQRLQFDQPDEFDHESWVDEKAQKMAKELARHIGDRLTKWPDVTAKALELVNANLPQQLIEHWPEHVNAYTKEREQEEFLDI